VFKRSKPKTCKVPVSVQNKKTQSLEELINIVKTQKHDLKEIENALVSMTNKFPFPEDESKAKKHFEFVYFFSKNPLCTAKLIVKMQKELSLANPKYAKQIESYQMLAVDARK